MSDGVIREHRGGLTLKERLVLQFYYERIKIALRHTKDSVSEGHYVIICSSFHYHYVCCAVWWIF